MRDNSPFLPGKNINLDFLQNKKFKKIKLNFVTAKKVEIELPSRIHLNLLDDSRMSTSLPGCGGIVLATNINTTAIVIEAIAGDSTIIETNTQGTALIKHIVSIFKKIFSLDNMPLKISLYQDEKIHMGFGSTAMKLIGMAIAINAFLGFPLNNNEVRKLVGFNYVENADKKGSLIRGYETGGASIASLYGGLTLFSDKLEIVENVALSDDYKIMIFSPNDRYTGNKNITRDVHGEDRVYEKGKKFRSLIPATAYKIFFDLLPAMKKKDIPLIGDILYDLNFMMGNIGTITNRYSVSYYALFEKIRELGGIITGISSAGPSIFVVARKDKIQLIKNELLPDIGVIYGIGDISHGLKINIDGKEKTTDYPDLSIY